MSWLAYERLTLQPDFSKPPQYGIDDERETIESPGGSRGFAAWAGHTDKTFLFEFQTHASEEWRQLREFFDRHGGRARAFYLPTWQHDFELAADAAAGDLLITLAGHWFAANVTEYRPDTLGRTLFIFNHLGQIELHRVFSFGETGANDVIQLDTPLGIPLEAGRCMVGFCHLARLTNDTIESEHLSIDHARASLGFRSVIQTRRLNQTENAQGPEIASMNANNVVAATDEDPIFQDTRRSECLGPFVRGLPQTENFQSAWVANLDPVTNLVTLDGPAGATMVATIYNAPGPAAQIALTFDASGKEVVAWVLDGKVWVGWITGGSTANRISFDGISVVAFNTFGIDSTVNAGTATVAIFYLKQDDATIYCRIISESFGTVHRYCKSPLAPLFLHAARRFEGRLEIVGMDAGHRLAIWQSFGYLTPPEIQISSTTLDGVAGDYVAVVRFVDLPDENGSTSMVEAAGEYRSVVVPAPPLTENGSTSLVDTGGSYTTARIEAPPWIQPVGNTTLDTTVPGSYLLVAIYGDQEDNGSTTLDSIGGSYG